MIGEGSQEEGLEMWMVQKVVVGLDEIRSPHPDVPVVCFRPQLAHPEVDNEETEESEGGDKDLL